jgi:2-phospho-L-lactate transferase/gluconeogenesis factor (CofD/UPF0052 family)
VEAGLRGLVRGDDEPPLPGGLSNAFEDLSVRRRRALVGYLKRFLEYCDGRQAMPTLDDCAVGNLIFAGAYCASGRDFNAAVRALVKLCEARARLVNVSRGESRVLTAVKADGEVLSSEAEIVGPQSYSPILDFFLLPRALTSAQKGQLTTLGTTEKRQCLRSWEEEVQLSREADKALRNADLIVYGPGTQFSSLFPSYRARGLGSAIRCSRARAKVLIANLDFDSDIQGWSTHDLIDKMLDFLDDPQNDSQMITHLLCDDRAPVQPRALLPCEAAAPIYKHIQIIPGEFRAALPQAVHCGRSVVQRLFELHQITPAPVGVGDHFQVGRVLGAAEDRPVSILGTEGGIP